MELIERFLFNALKQTTKKYLLAAIILSSFIFTSISIVLREDKRSCLISKNAILASASRSNKIEPNDLGYENFANITKLNLRSAADIKEAQDLNTLTLSNVHVSDFEPLKEIANLQYLTINEEQIIDFGIQRY